VSTPRRNEIGTAEVIGSRCLATDQAIGLPIKHVPQSTLLALRRVDRLGLDAEFATRTYYYDCLLSCALLHDRRGHRSRVVSRRFCSSASTRSCAALRHRR
jgi:hypothetical protein